MVTLQFIFERRLPGRSAYVRLSVKGKALLVTTLANALEYV